MPIERRGTSRKRDGGILSRNTATLHHRGIWPGKGEFTEDVLLRKVSGSWHWLGQARKTVDSST